MFLARSTMEATLLLLILAFVIVMTIANNRAKDRRERLRIIEEALRSGNLQPRAQDELVQELTGRRPQPERVPAQRPGSFARLLFAFGWLGLFAGAAVLLGGSFEGDDELLMAGCIVAAASFGVMSLPMALRELDRKSNRSSA